MPTSSPNRRTSPTRATADPPAACQLLPDVEILEIQLRNMYDRLERYVRKMVHRGELEETDYATRGRETQPSPRRMSDSGDS